MSELIERLRETPPSTRLAGRVGRRWVSEGRDTGRSARPSRIARQESGVTATGGVAGGDHSPDAGNMVYRPGRVSGKSYGWVKVRHSLPIQPVEPLTLHAVCHVTPSSLYSTLNALGVCPNVPPSMRARIATCLQT